MPIDSKINKSVVVCPCNGILNTRENAVCNFVHTALQESHKGIAE